MKLVIGRKSIFEDLKKDENLFSLAITCYYLRIAINDINYYQFRESSVLLSLIVNFLAVVLFCCMIPIFKMKNRIQYLFLGELLLGCIFGMSILLQYDKVWIFSDTVKHVMVFYIPLSVAAICIKDKKNLLKKLYVCSFAVLPLLIFAISSSYQRIGKSYNMEAGYVIMLPLLVVLSHFFEKHRWYDLILAFIASCFVLFIGSRGPIICLLVFCIIYFLTSEKISLKNKIIYMFSLVVIFAIVFAVKDELIQLLIDVANYYGFEARTLLLLSQKSITSDSGRGVLFNYYMEHLNKHPILGYGVLSNWINEGDYPHNIWVEFLYSFGYPMGIALFILVVYIMYKGVTNGDKDASNINRIFVSMCASLLLSNSFLRVWYFFVCIGLCLSKGESDNISHKKY